MNVLADLTHWHSSGESACPLCKAENVGQKTSGSETQELLTETIHIIALSNLGYSQPYKDRKVESSVNIKSHTVELPETL